MNLDRWLATLKKTSRTRVIEAMQVNFVFESVCQLLDYQGDALSTSFSVAGGSDSSWITPIAVTSHSTHHYCAQVIDA